MFFEDKIDDAKYCGHLYGLGTSFVVNGSSTTASTTTTTTTTSFSDNGHTPDVSQNS